MIFFFNDTATTEIYTLSLHDALPISYEPAGRLLVRVGVPSHRHQRPRKRRMTTMTTIAPMMTSRSEEHTSELQSRQYLVCRLLLETKICPPIPPTYRLTTCTLPNHPI